MLVSKNKLRKLENRDWDGAGKWQMKKAGPEGRLSSCFIEGMSEAEINQMISDAFSNSLKDLEWKGIVRFKGMEITVSGYFRFGKIESAFITKIQ